MEAKTKKDGSLVSMSTILSPVEFQVIQIIYRDGFTQQEAAQEFGYTQARVSQIHTAAIQRLQKEKSLILDFDL